MIFVTIGFSSEYDFQRLLKEMDRVAGEIREEVNMQISGSSYQPKHARFFRFASREEMGRFYREARVVVCHGGVGAIVSAATLGKPIIVVPRLKKYGELSDDHQTDLVKKLGQEMKMRVVFDVAELEGLLSGGPLAPALLIRDASLAAGLKRYVGALEEAAKRRKNRHNTSGKGDLLA